MCMFVDVGSYGSTSLPPRESGTESRVTVVSVPAFLPESLVLRVESWVNQVSSNRL